MVSMNGQKFNVDASIRNDPRSVVALVLKNSVSSGHMLCWGIGLLKCAYMVQVYMKLTKH